MLVALLAGTGVGLGALTIVRAVAAPAPPLAHALRALEQPRRPSGKGALAVAVIEGLGIDLGRTRRDLAVTGTTAENHAVGKIFCALAFLGLPFACAGMLRLGGVHPPLGLVALSAVALALVGFLVPDLLLRNEAYRRRREFRHALGAYLDLVAIVVAGGGGTETALYSAVEIGNGWPFDELRRALRACRLAAEAPWTALDRLGVELGVDELREIAASVGLAGEHGAKVRQSLAVRAASMRDHRIAELEADAQAATEKMSIPVVLMLFGFVAFVLYPALQLVLDGL